MKLNKIKNLSLKLEQYGNEIHIKKMLQYSNWIKIVKERWIKYETIVYAISEIFI